jgi:hypothetical protein
MWNFEIFNLWNPPAVFKKENHHVIKINFILFFFYFFASKVDRWSVGVVFRQLRRRSQGATSLLSTGTQQQSGNNHNVNPQHLPCFYNQNLYFEPKHTKQKGGRCHLFGSDWSQGSYSRALQHSRLSHLVSRSLVSGKFEFSRYCCCCWEKLTSDGYCIVRHLIKRMGFCLVAWLFSGSWWTLKSEREDIESAATDFVDNHKRVNSTLFSLSAF